MNTYRKQNAFTLAEVLVTLAIIGVVTALTIPSVIARYQEKQTVAAVRKFYSEASDAYNRAIAENDEVASRLTLEPHKHHLRSIGIVEQFTRTIVDEE